MGELIDANYKFMMILTHIPVWIFASIINDSFTNQW